MIMKSASWVKIFLPLWKLNFEVGILTFSPNILPYSLVCKANTWPTFTFAAYFKSHNRIPTKAPVVFLRKFTDYFPGTCSLIF